MTLIPPSLPPINMKPILLAAQVTTAFNNFHHLAYAHLTADFHLEQASPNFAAVLSEPVLEIIGQPLTDLVWEFVGAEAALTAVLHQTTPAFILERVNRTQPDHTTICLNFYITPLRDPDLGPGLLLIAEDVTNQAQLEQSLVQDRNNLRLMQLQLARAHEALQHLDRLKSLFLSMVAHDLRSPLATIRGYADLMREDLSQTTNETGQGLATIISSQANRLDRLIDDLLELNQIEDGRFTLHRDKHNLNQIIQGIIQELIYHITNRRQQLRVTLCTPELWLLLDAQRIRQVIYNLLSNAIKYTPEQGHLELKLWREENTAVLQISDTGYGMTPGQLQRLFQLYYRADAPENQTIRGTGLGLFIVKTFIEAHGGQVKVTSKRHKGSTFTIYLPI